MIFLKFFSFLFFINLHNSFKIINTIRMNRNKVFMGCDYYIEQCLCIYYNDNTSYYISLDRERGYYSDTDIYDDFIMISDIENSKLTEWEKNKQYHLTPKTKPFIIYNNHTFTNIDVSNKYKSMLEFEMINNEYKTWNDIKDIVILEERYERY